MKTTLTRLYNFLKEHRLTPSFDDDSIFLLAVAVIVLLIIDADAQAFASKVSAHSSKASLIILLGISFATYSVFFAQFKNEVQKFYMFWFAILMSYLSSIGAIILLNISSVSIFLYFAPILNIIVSIFILIFWYADVIDTSCISYKSSSFFSAVYGVIVITSFTLIGVHVLNWPWPAVLSMAVTYSTVFNKYFSGRLPTYVRDKDKKIEEIDLAVNRAIEHLIDTLNRGYQSAGTIVTQEEIKVITMPPEYEYGTERFLADEVRKLNRTNEVVAVAVLGSYTIKRHWFSKEHQEHAIIVDVYSNVYAKGHQFCQMIRVNSDGQIWRFRGVMYTGRLVNIFS